MSVLFNPAYLTEHKKDFDLPNYIRTKLDFIRNKYQDIPGIDTKTVQSECENLKPSISDFLHSSSSNDLQETFFGNNFLSFQQLVNSRFLEENSNLLLDIYLIASTNSAECER